MTYNAWYAKETNIFLVWKFLNLFKKNKVILIIIEKKCLNP